MTRFTLTHLCKRVDLIKQVTIGLTLLSLVGCASTSVDHNRSKSSARHKNADYYSIEDQGLRTYYNNWSGVPYRFGGTTKSGIDCSAFTQRIYKDEFNMKLPRMTSGQSSQGKKIIKEQRKIGDLIFFKTGRHQRHVGVYVGNNRFMHASTSQGVMISNLNNDYWKKAYWQTRRILN